MTYDVDGTLLNSKKIITKKTKAAIENAIAEGKNIALSTGRGQAELRETYEILPDLRYVVSYSGAHVLDRKENKVIYSAAFDKSVAEKIFEVVKDKDIMIQLLTATKSVVQADKLVDISRYGMTVYQESYDRIATPVDDIHEFFMTTEEPIYKINLYHRTHDERVITKEELSGLDIETVFSEKTSVECSVKGVTKGVGVQKLAEYLGITMDEVISVGDADNDYDVLTKSGLAVAMANANDNIRGIADVLVTTNNYDGCAEALRYYC
ncbi:MAG: Cof-type HAD-IIB family hydrolase [Clostridia bacterium]|nr:Cof-type HAD-IIB family hydrolase [Clostridia bacterium]